MLSLRIVDMTCGHCAGTIARAIAGADKAARIEVDVRAKLVHIESTAPSAELVEAIAEAGYTAEKVEPVPAGTVRNGAGCGCGCGKRAPAPVDVAQAAAPQAKSCCG